LRVDRLDSAGRGGFLLVDFLIAERRGISIRLAVRPFGAPGQGPQRDSAEINAQKSEIGAQHLSPNPADSKARASINEKFQRYENKFASDPRMSDDRRERLNRTRAFLVNLIDFGYAPLTVDSWCDDLLDDRVDDGMPMDLVRQMRVLHLPRQIRDRRLPRLRRREQMQPRASPLECRPRPDRPVNA
jgi:hypothetical protein